jgi:hypothetical protein
VPAVPACFIEPLWVQFEALLPKRPTYHPDHPLGCHKPRIGDRIIFDKLIQVLVFGCSYEKTPTPPARPLRSATAATNGFAWASSLSLSASCWTTMTASSA